MRQQRSIFSLFFFLFLATIIIIAFSRSAPLQWVIGMVETGVTPLQKGAYTSLHTTAQSKTLSATDENNQLLKKFVAMDSLEKENAALADQFKTTSPASSALMPAHIIGMPSFIPNVTTPDTLIIDVGENDKVAKNDAVIVDNSLVGKIEETSFHRATVALLTRSDISFLGKTAPIDSNIKEALGVIRGLGNGDMLLQNVVLSDTLQVGDVVVTKGDAKQNMSGLPPGLIVGKIITVNKKPSELFQTAEVKSLVDISKASIVFVLTIQ